MLGTLHIQRCLHMSRNLLLYTQSRAASPRVLYHLLPICNGVHSSSSFIDIIGLDLLPPLRLGLSSASSRLPSGLSSLVTIIAGGSNGLEALAALKSGLALPASISAVSGLGAGIRFCPASEPARLWPGDTGGSYSQALFG